MKKVVSILLVIFVMTINVFANTPEFLTTNYTNYTADYSISVAFNSSEDVAALLEELEFPEEAEWFVDVKALLKSLLSYDGKMFLQADISNDYKKIKVGLTAESAQSIDVNSNLNVGLNTKTGMWMNMDLTSLEKPVLEIICSFPIFNKYLKMDLSEQLTEIDELFAIYDKEYIEDINRKSAEALLKYAEITPLTINKYTIKLNNDGLIAYIEEIMPYVLEKTSSIYGDNEFTSYFTMPSLEGWTILGDEGIECSYVTSNRKLKSSDFKAHFSINISEMYSALTGMDWDYNAEGLFDFTVNMTVKMSDIDKTKVSFPVLTEENTMDFEDFMPQYESEYDYEYDGDMTEVSYPTYYVDVYCSRLPQIDGDIYVPLRQTLEAAYEDTVSIAYNDGVVTAVSEYFPEFDTLTVVTGSDKMCTDETEFVMGSVEIDGVTYVNTKLFCNVFGWELYWVQHDLLSNEYNYTFYTEW